MDVNTEDPKLNVKLKCFKSHVILGNILNLTVIILILLNGFDAIQLPFWNDTYLDLVIFAIEIVIFLTYTLRLFEIREILHIIRKNKESKHIDQSILNATIDVNNLKRIIISSGVCIICLIIITVIYVTNMILSYLACILLFISFLSIAISDRLIRESYDLMPEPQKSEEK